MSLVSKIMGSHSEREIKRIMPLVNQIEGMEEEMRAKSDEELRAKVAKQWSEWNHAEITPDMINCDGCRLDGAKTPYCASLCPIPRCAQNKGLETCGDCPEKVGCQDLHVIVWDNETARRNLGME